MNALIEKARTASTEQLMEMAMLLNDASDKIGSMTRMAVSVALEDRLSSEEFVMFFNGLDA